MRRYVGWIHIEPLQNGTIIHNTILEHHAVDAVIVDAIFACVRRMEWNIGSCMDSFICKRWAYR